jgi:hypothetical protein
MESTRKGRKRPDNIHREDSPEYNAINSSDLQCLVGSDPTIQMEEKDPQGVSRRNANILAGSNLDSIPVANRMLLCQDLAILEKGLEEKRQMIRLLIKQCSVLESRRSKLNNLIRAMPNDSL